MIQAFALMRSYEEILFADGRLSAYNAAQSCLPYLLPLLVSNAVVALG
jgi:hypothetical protein